ncbi:PEP-CTERM protein-sorting domain-containing protein [Sphingomonas laterariae]|uniref:PEP-CTERM protein-sorting domain-containing protein n=1 Tax=Edaphosphingomonas laterariae TaxID=861865 RepID=A0A239CGQ4_9SPHN|nr:PEPxxWA-CTERM sorting domain-containing protein [Sphingomonas laterariae]SNS18848.1 PEP-CTERM protein-sorting domain-containing protein [Sphingomonas laterariae]
MKRALAYAATAASLAIAAPASAAIIAPVGVTASSTFWTYDVDNLINGSGVAGGFHDGNYNNAWMTETTGEPAHLIFDLGAAYDLSSALIWQFNVDFGLDRGVRDFAISLSTDGMSFADATAGTLMQGTSQPLPAQLVELAGTARYVRLDLLNNYGDQWTWTGLSEVRFDGTVAAVPEPASWAMMIGGFGLVGGAMRRRHVQLSFA